MRSGIGYADLESRLSRIASTYAERADVTDLQFALASPGRGWHWRWSAPGSIRQYFIASATKLYVTALLMQLRAEGRVSLDDPAAGYLQPSVMSGIHVRNGVDHGNRITVRQLLSHTSGIADYFEQRRSDGSTTIGRALEQDFSWTFEDVLRIVKEELRPRFDPSSRHRAFYADTNFQLLGKIVETLCGCSFEAALQQRILLPLDLGETWPFTASTIDRYASVAPMLNGRQAVVIPLAMSSVRADGGLVSTADDGIAFLDAFINGRLFPGEYLADLTAAWRRIFAPLEYGTGIMRFALPRYYTVFRKLPSMIGHSGASGAVLFHVPALDLYASGTVNQIRKRSLSYNLMARLVMACEDAWRHDRS